MAVSTDSLEFDIFLRIKVTTSQVYTLRADTRHLYTLDKHVAYLQ